MQAKHTPGPWLIADDKSPFVYALNDQGINRFSLSVSRGFVDDKPTNPDELLATAKLIAAAPDLLSHLKFAVKLLGAMPLISGTAQVEAMRAALAKAGA